MNPKVNVITDRRRSEQEKRKAARRGQAGRISTTGLLAAGAVVCILAAAAGWWMTRRAGPPNVILITVDTLRADHLGVYGYSRPTSPNIDAFAKESIVYRRAFSHAPETNPSLSSLMTSLYPHETKVFRNFHQLQEGVVTLAERLQSGGWRTGAIVSNYSLRRGSGFEQGFDDYDDRLDLSPTATWEGLERVGRKTTSAALTWLRQHRDQRIFLWVHYMDPHAPYTPPEPYNTLFTGDGQGEHRELEFLDGSIGTGGIPRNARLDDRRDYHYYVSQYDGEIRYLDDALGDLLKEARALGLLDRSVVIVTADHGEGMGEFDYFFNHFQFVYSGLVHVPLLVRFPDARMAGTEISSPVGLMDILPTVLDVAGLEKPDALRGRSLLEGVPHSVFTAALAAPGQSALIDGNLKLLMTQGVPRLFDLQQDFYETRNLLEDSTNDHATAAVRMRETMLAISESDRGGLGAPMKWTVHPGDREQLRALGYVQ